MFIVVLCNYIGWNTYNPKLNSCGPQVGVKGTCLAPTWPHMAQYGPIWHPMAPYGPILHQMAADAIIWFI